MPDQNVISMLVHMGTANDFDFHDRIALDSQKINPSWKLLTILYVVHYLALGIFPSTVNNNNNLYFALLYSRLISWVEKLKNPPELMFYISL